MARIIRVGSRLIVSLAAAVAFTCASVSLQATAADVPAGLESGAIVVSTHPHAGTSVRWGRAVGIVEAPMADVMKVVSDYGAYHEFLPHFETSRVLSKRGQRALVYVEARIVNTVKVWAQLKMTPEPQGEVQVVNAIMTKGNLEHMEARFQVSRLSASRCLVTFDILVDPKLPLPASLVSAENEKASRRTIRALRQRLAAAQLDHVVP